MDIAAGDGFKFKRAGNVSCSIVHTDLVMLYKGRHGDRLPVIYHGHRSSIKVDLYADRASYHGGLTRKCYCAGNGQRTIDGILLHRSGLDDRLGGGDLFICSKSIHH